MQSGPNKALCIHISAVPIFKKALNKDLAEKTPEWLSIAELAKKIKVDLVNEIYQELFKEGSEKKKLNDIPVRSQLMQSGTRKVQCIHKSLVHIFYDEFKKFKINKNLIATPTSKLSEQEEPHIKCKIDQIEKGN